ncbi:hypothetical protein GCM10010174_81120 [Kutzneria viridogrisea]
MYVVCCQKGGVGKTTTTNNLAAIDAKVFPPQISQRLLDRIQALSAQPGGMDVVSHVAATRLLALCTGKDKLLDCPPAVLNDLRTTIGPLSRPSIAGVEEDAVHAALVAMLQEVEPQVLAISTDPQKSLLEWLTRVEKTRLREGRPMPMDYAQEDKNPHVLGKLKQMRRYRRIWVDSPGWLPGEDEENKKAILGKSLESADMAIVVIEPEDLAFTPTKQTINDVIKPAGIPFLVVINNWDPRDGEGDLNDTLTRCHKQGWPVAKTTVRRYKMHTSAPAAGLLCTSYKPNRKTSEAVQDYTELNLEITAGR